jgi:hypothetical protein
MTPKIGGFSIVTDTPSTTHTHSLIQMGGVQKAQADQHV